MRNFKIIRDIDGKYKCVEEGEKLSSSQPVDEAKVYGEPNPQRCLAFLEAVNYLHENVTGEWELHY